MAGYEGTESVMVVDDELGIVQVASRLLRESGYRVVVASNGLECVARMKDGFRGVILMDVAMPLLDGWQTIRQLQREQLLGQSLVCMLTGLEPEDEGAGVEDCVVDYLRKPFSKEALLAMVSSAFEMLCSR